MQKKALHENCAKETGAKPFSAIKIRGRNIPLAQAPHLLIKSGNSLLNSAYPCTLFNDEIFSRNSRKLFYHRNKGNKIIWIAEIEPSAYQNITVADNQLIRILEKRDTARIKKRPRVMHGR